MENVIIIGAEHHFIQVSNIFNHFKLEPSNYIVVFFCHEDKTWPTKLIREFGIQNSRIFSNWTFVDLLYRKSIYKEYLKFLTSLKSESNIKNLFVSQFFNDSTLLAFNILKPSCFYLMDEGTASFLVLKHRELKDVNYKWRIKLFVKSMLYKKQLRFPDSIAYFTQYDLNVAEKDSIIRYSLSKKSNTINHLNNDICFILGSSVVEVGIIKQEYYFELLINIKNLNRFKVIEYFPHRKEDALKLEKIKSLGFKIINVNRPFENHFNNLSSLPKVIYSFYSPVLENLTKMYEILPELVVIELENNKVALNKETVQLIYDNYRKNPLLKVVSLSNQMNIQDERQ